MTASRLFLIATVAVIPATGAIAQPQPPIAIQDVRVQAYLEKSGRFSDAIQAAAATLKDAPRGESSLGEPASNIVVSIVVSGPKGGESNRDIALHMANVTVTQRLKTGPRTQSRTYAGFRFNTDGMAYRSFMLENATCAPLEIDVKLGRSRKQVKYDFDCTEIETPAKPVVAKQR